MRFEPGIQPLLDRLRAALGLDYKSFSPTSSQLLPGALRRYHFRPNEIRDGDALSTLEMLELGVLRLFQESQPQLPQLDASTIASARVGRSSDDVWTTVVQPWIDGFGDDASPSYNDLRKTSRLHGRPLYAQGFWNAMSEVLSPDAIRYIRDEGTFYHLIPDNPNAWGSETLSRRPILRICSRIELMNPNAHRAALCKQTGILKPLTHTDLRTQPPSAML